MYFFIYTNHYNNIFSIVTSQQQLDALLQLEWNMNEYTFDYFSTATQLYYQINYSINQFMDYIYLILLDIDPQIPFSDTLRKKVLKTTFKLFLSTYCNGLYKGERTRFLLKGRGDQKDPQQKPFMENLIIFIPIFLTFHKQLLRLKYLHDLQSVDKTCY